MLKKLVKFKELIPVVATFIVATHFCCSNLAYAMESDEVKNNEVESDEVEKKIKWNFNFNIKPTEFGKTLLSKKKEKI